MEVPEDTIANKSIRNIKKGKERMALLKFIEKYNSLTGQSFLSEIV